MPDRKVPDTKFPIKHVITNMTGTPFDNHHVKKLINKYLNLSNSGRDYHSPARGVDPFARESFTTCLAGFLTNDLNETMPTDYHLEANEFARLVYAEGCGFDICLFDPPYTLRQLKDLYMDDNNKMDDTIPLWQTQNMWGDCKNYLGKCMNVGSYVISFGYHSHGFGKRRGFEKVEMLICEQSGSNDRYDVLVTVEKKVQMTLFQTLKS